jgi:hypothetical protein
MASNSSGLRGVIHGRTIELHEEPGLPDGQEVAVALQPIRQVHNDTAPLAQGEGLRRSAGAWAEDAAELDAYLEWNRQQRKMSRRGMEP